MSPPLTIDVITIFPRMLDGVLGESMMKRAAAGGAVSFFDMTFLPCHHVEFISPGRKQDSREQVDEGKVSR